MLVVLWLTNYATMRPACQWSASSAEPHQDRALFDSRSSQGFELHALIVSPSMKLLHIQPSPLTQSGLVAMLDLHKLHDPELDLVVLRGLVTFPPEQA